MHHGHGKKSARSRVRTPFIRALVQRLRGKADARAHGNAIEPDPLLDGARATPGVRERWAEIARGFHHPDEPVILDEEGSRELIDEILNGSPLTPGRRATFERMRLMAEVHGRSEELEHPLPAAR